MTYDAWKRTDPLDLGCEHSRCDHGICRHCEPECAQCLLEDDEDYARAHAAWAQQEGQQQWQR